MSFLFSPVGILIILNVAVFFLPTFVNFSGKSFSGSSSESFLAMGWKDNYEIKNGEYYRLITAMFLHADSLHLLSNMWALFTLGAALSTFFPLIFIITYFVAGIAGNLFSFFFHPSPSVGASGAIFGLVGYILFSSLINQNYSGALNLLLYVGLSFVLAFLPGSRIDIFGHLGGLLAGFGMALATLGLTIL